MKDNKRVAVFIDAENISAKFAERLMSETSNYGDVIVRRVFADWSSPNVKEWQDVVKKHSLLAEQQFSPVKGKNSGDISLIINAMIVLFEKDIDVFCLASSDSDFTRLVQELREREKTVIGFGLKQTASAFVNAFSEFIYLDNTKEKSEIADDTSKKADDKHQDKPSFLLESDRLDNLKEIVDKLIEEDGRALYARIATEMKNKYSDFVPKNYGCKSLKELIGKNIQNLGCYAIKTDSDGTTMFLIADEVCKLKVQAESKNIEDTERENKPYEEKQRPLKSGGAKRGTAPKRAGTYSRTSRGDKPSQRTGGKGSGERRQTHESGKRGTTSQRRAKAHQDNK